MPCLAAGQALEMKGCMDISHCIQTKTEKLRVISRMLLAIIAFGDVYFNN